MLHHFRYPYSLYVYLHGAPPIFRVNATNFHKLRQVWGLECLGFYQPCTRCLLQISQQKKCCYIVDKKNRRENLLPGSHYSHWTGCSSHWSGSHFPKDFAAKNNKARNHHPCHVVPLTRSPTMKPNARLIHRIFALTKMGKKMIAVKKHMFSCLHMHVCEAPYTT